MHKARHYIVRVGRGDGCYVCMTLYVSYMPHVRLVYASYMFLYVLLHVRLVLIDT